MSKKHLTQTDLIQEKYQIIWNLYQQGLNQQEIAQATDYTQGHISYILKRCRMVGNKCAKVGKSSGAPPKLGEAELVKLAHLLQQEAQANGFANNGWTQRRVQILIKRKFEIDYSLSHISRILSKIGFSLQVPTLKDPRQNQQEKQEYIEETMPELKKKSKPPFTDLFYVDEASFHLTGNQFTTYAPKGKGVTVVKHQSVTHRVYSVSAISPEGQLLSSAQLEPFDSEHIVAFLKKMLKKLSHRLIIVWDNASIHTSKYIKHFLKTNPEANRVELQLLPRYSPELNPDEQVWGHLKNHRLIRKEFTTVKGLKKEVIHQLQKMAQQPELIKKFFRHPAVEFY